ncbi:MAG: TetR/AcrR family transcriptional regulator [Cyanobacteria bacterium J06621_8]
MAKTNARDGGNSKSEIKTEVILSGAMQEFLANGYAATSMDKVAKAAKVSKATVYSHFGDKESLFAAVIQSLAEDKFTTVMGLETSQSLAGDPQQVLSAIARRMIENAAEDVAFQNFIRIIIGESGRFPELAKVYVQNLAKPAIEKLTIYFNAHPELNLTDPEAAVRVIMGTLIYYVMLQKMLHGDEILPLSSDRLIKTLTEIILSQ